MPSAITRTNRNGRSRRLSGQQRPLQRPIAIGLVDVTAAASVLTITFDQAVTLKGVPKYTTNLVGPTALSAVMTNPTTLALTFSAAVATATEVRIPFEEPAIRNPSGGFVSPRTFPV